jgi:hypothetical protein
MENIHYIQELKTETIFIEKLFHKYTDKCA